MPKFLDPTKDTVFKSMWLKGNQYVRRYLERIVEYSIGHKLPKYNIGPNATGVISYKAIANEVDILLVSCDNESKINVEMNRLGKYASKRNIFTVMNKSDVYLGTYIGNFYNDLPEEKRYNVSVKVEQVNLNNFYFEENKLIQELHFELVDKNYDVTKDGIKIHQIYLPRMAEICYDKEEDIYRDFLLLMSKSYEEMEKVAGDNKERCEVVKFLKRLGADDEFMSIIDKEEYNRIQQEITLQDQKELATKEGIEKGIEETKKETAVNLYKNGASKELICSSLNISKEKLEEYLRDKD